MVESPSRILMRRQRTTFVLLQSLVIKRVFQQFEKILVCKLDSGSKGAEIC